MSSKNTIPTGTSSFSSSPSSSLPSQETKTPLKLKNPFKKFLSKGQNVCSKDKSHVDQEVIKKIQEAKTPVDEKAIKKTQEAKTPDDQEANKRTPEAKTRKQQLQEEEKVDFEGVQGEVNAVQETPTRETQAKQDNVEGLFLQMRQAEIEGKRSTPLPSMWKDSVEQSIPEGMSLGEEEAEQTMSPSGFDFQHLLVLQDFPLSYFYGVDFNNLNLPPKPSSHVQSLYGLDEESLAAENAALDEFYAKRKCEKIAWENDQSSGNQGSEDRSGNLLFPDLASEEDDDIRTLKNLFGYKLYFGSLPYVPDQPATTLDPHPLLAYLNSKLREGGCISESRLTEKVIKLQTKYKKLVTEKGKTPKRQDFSTPGDYSFFRLSRMTWEGDKKSDIG